LKFSEDCFKKSLAFFAMMLYTYTCKIGEGGSVLNVVTLIIWIVVLVAALALEAVSMQLFSVWFAVGAIAAIFAACFGAEVWLQIVLFVGVSAVALFATRPLVQKLRKQHVAAATNAPDLVLKKIGEVTTAIDNIRGEGFAKIGGQFWSARSNNEEPIPVGTLVRVLRVEGVKLIVEIAD
jgi:membrane protein implicated in regulation of membrane protease activity